ncbi:MAG: hypothetical protein WCX82_03330 [archaeon]|jgi:hypothetical protein
MTKSFEVAIAIILLLCFVFFLFESVSQEYKNTPIPEDLKNVILLNAKNSEFRGLVEESDVENIYSLLYPQMDYKFNVSICEWLSTSCITKELTGFTKKKEFVYYFADSNKTLHIQLN